MKQKNNRRKPYLLLSILLHATLLLLFTVYGFRGIKKIVQPPLRRQETKVEFVKEDETPPQEDLVRLSPKFSSDAKPAVSIQDKPVKTNTSTDQKKQTKSTNKSPAKKSTSSTPKKIHIKKRENKTSVISKKTVIDPPLDLKKIALANLLRPKKDINHSDEKAEEVTVKHETKSILSIPKSTLECCGGDGFINRDGIEKFPDLKDMKVIGYEQRLVRHLGNTFKMYFQHILKNPKYLIRNGFAWNFFVNKKGGLKSFILEKSSGNPLFDKFLYKLHKKAVPFPPIPDHLGVEYFSPRGGSVNLFS